MRIPEGATHYIRYTIIPKTDYFRIVNDILQVHKSHIGWVNTRPTWSIDRFLKHPVVKKLVVEPKVFSYEHT